MKHHYPSTGLERLCGLFGKTRQAYYEQNWRTSNERLQEALIVDKVKEVRRRIPGIGGLPLHHMLREELFRHGIVIGRDSFYELLRKHNLLIKRRKRYVVTTDSDHPYYKWNNLIKNINLTAPEQLWVSDITYLETGTGFVYLSLVTDAYSRKIIGYHLSQRLQAQGCLIALNKAISSLSVSREIRQLIHHSDRGIQYCCESYITALQQNNIGISMTQTGSPYDNAIAERINGILKHQLGLGQVFTNYAAATDAVCKAVDAYNTLRPHRSISNLTPDKAHRTKQKIHKTWKSKTKTTL